MQRLNAIDAISPAWEHTRQLLFTRINWRLLLKIGAVACFARMGGCNANFNNFNRVPHGTPASLAAMMAVLVVGGIVLLVLWLGFFYLGSRLQFVLFDVVLRRETVIAPIWRRYGAATWRWIGLQVIYLVLCLICMAPLLIPFVLFVFRLARSGHQMGSHDFTSFFLSVLGFIAIALMIIIVLSCVYSLLRDFGLPSMALEGTPLKETVRRVWWLLRAEPGQVVLYLIMKLLLNLAGTIACYMAMLVGALVAMIPLGGAALGLWLGLRHAATAGHILMWIGWGLLGLIFVALLFVAWMMMCGYLLTFLQAYALYFLGGRYPLLGEILQPEPPPLYPYPPPSFFPPPPPADPAVA